MYLKELTLRGFKSFASATTLRFEPGITAVVGPNGSGKSNIVDALTWVMGEQGAKNLRGTSMEDVIFAGTSSRPPLGRAQVTLTIDNSDHTLDIDYSEVTISRTIFRNGGSEYAINGSQCRLLDIQELLSDTGLGQQMHVIVGQGRLDAILRADSSGHRAFIEEAAGILKHRKRKERAQRKLANTEANLSRLDDLLGEIHRQLGPLGRQARISRKAENIQVALRDAQSRIYAEDASKSLKQREETRRELTQVRGQLMELQKELSQVKVRINQVEGLSSASSPAMSKINQTWHDLSRIQERLNSLSSLAKERAGSLRGQMVENFGEDPDMLEQRAQELDGQAREQQTLVSQARLELDKAVEERASREKQLASVRQTLTELRTSEQERDAQIANLRELVAREESAVQLATSRSGDFANQRKGLEGQRDQARAQLETLDGQVQDLADDDGKALDQARQALQEAQEDLNQAQDQQRKADAQRISLKAKADALTDTLESRNASGALERDGQVGAMGRLTDFIHVQEGWEEAVAHALDAFASAMVVPDTDAMLHALERAASDKLGKAVLLHPWMAGQEPSQEKDFRDPCAAALLSVNPAAEDQPLAQEVVQAVQALLADTFAARDRKEALEAIGQKPWKLAVTLQGEIINPVGAIGGSSLSQSDLSLAARRDKALQEIRGLDEEMAKLDQAISQAQSARDQARATVDQEAQKRTEARVKAQQAQQSLASARQRLDAVEDQLKALDAKIEQVQDEGQSHAIKLKDLQTALAQAQESTADHADFSDLTEREHGLEAGLSQSREREVTANIAWKDASRKAESLERQAGLLHDQAKEAVARRTRLQELNERRSTQARTVEQIAADALAVAALVEASLAQVVKEREALQAAASSHDQELRTLRGQRDQLEPKVQALQTREHELDVDRERLAASYGQLTQKVSDDLGLSLEELLDHYGPDQPVPVLDDQGKPIPLEGAESAQAEAATETEGSASTGDAEAERASEEDQSVDESRPGEETDGRQPAIAYQTVPYDRQEQIKRLKKAQRDLEALGKINPLATEEYDALQSRNQYLNDQRKDVAKSRDDLMQLIRDLDSTMIQVFKSAFDDTAEAFQTVFGTLFPGGTGRLRLENPDDLLTTGVLVEASPAGKRVKQLGLLSGGERSLTALALLFAIFTARPSPFYVMDEVEAALDDLNLTRLINAFNQLREHAQLIIITHQQRTMSIADALYGITMRGDGVTSVISQKLEYRSAEDGQQTEGQQ
ncbi:chromosome segregation protein SMC [Bifidobacterium aemilianum]|uniref:Chromosome partition protein Smc n=1 Tax=Bifidobacterium aemilianum TaxID=2493120 RepID=A0A366KBM6_9BIFI|nr:AAA family ATPase [Bifidobacterium aemilianum]RBP98523.1 chromosome segregation protein SMC [Bifidobacterium aemilianum]